MRNLKKLLCSFLAVCMVLTLLPAVAFAADDFGDTSGHWAKGSIDRWAGYEVFKGNDSGNFEPDREMTRGEFAQMLVNLMGYEEKVENTFSDVPANAWYSDAILSLLAAGVMQGDDAGHAYPEANISREQSAVMLCRALDIKPKGTDVSGSFSDADSVSGWAKDAMIAMTERGFMNGTPEGDLYPLADINKASVAQMVNNMVAEYVTTDGATITGDVDGVVIIKANNVTIENATLSEPLIVAPAASDSTVSLTGTTSAEDVVVAASGAKVVVAETASAKTVEVEAPKAGAEIAGKVDNVSVTEKATSATVTVDKTGSVDSVSSAASEAKVTVAGTVKDVNISGSKTEVDVSGTVEKVDVASTAGETAVKTETGAKVGSVTTAAKTTVSGASGTVGAVTATGSADVDVTVGGAKVENLGDGEVSANGKDVAQGETVTTPTTPDTPDTPSTPGGSGGGNSGGGSGGGSTTTPEPEPDPEPDPEPTPGPTEPGHDTLALTVSGTGVTGSNGSYSVSVEADAKVDITVTTTGTVNLSYTQNAYMDITGVTQNEAKTASSFSITGKQAVENFVINITATDGTLTANATLTVTVTAKPGENKTDLADSGVQITATPSSEVYTGEDIPVTVTIGGTQWTAENTDYTVSAPAIVDAGSYDVTVTATAANAKYTGSVKVTVKIEKATIIGVTIVPNQKGETLAAGDTLSLAYTTDSTTANSKVTANDVSITWNVTPAGESGTPGTNANGVYTVGNGDAKISATVKNNASSKNFQIVDEDGFTTDEAVVGKKPLPVDQIEWTIPTGWETEDNETYTLVYDGQNHKPSVNTLALEASAGDLTVTGLEATTDGRFKDAGTYIVSVTAGEDSEYYGSVTKYFTITKKALTISVDKKTIVVVSGTEAEVSITVTITGLVNSDTVTIGGANDQTWVTEGASNGNTATIKVSPKTMEADIYTLNVNLSADTKNYTVDSAVPVTVIVLSASLTGNGATDSAAVTGTLTAALNPASEKFAAAGLTAPTCTYKWYYGSGDSWTPIDSATTSTLNVSDVATDAAGKQIKVEIIVTVNNEEVHLTATTTGTVAGGSVETPTDFTYDTSKTTIDLIKDLKTYTGDNPEEATAGDLTAVNDSLELETEADSDANFEEATAGDIKLKITVTGKVSEKQNVYTIDGDTVNLRVGATGNWVGIFFKIPDNLQVAELKKNGDAPTIGGGDNPGKPYSSQGNYVYMFFDAEYKKGESKADQTMMLKFEPIENAPDGTKGGTVWFTITFQEQKATMP